MEDHQWILHEAFKGCMVVGFDILLILRILYHHLWFQLCIERKERYT